MNSFWQNLPKPFFVLAPMDDVTDSPFRRLMATLAPPDVYFTEFGNATGLQSNGRRRVLQKFTVHPDESESLLVAQLWGKVPEDYLRSAQELAATGNFAGIDINMGCPERNIVSKGCCSGLINTPELASDIITATKQGAGNLPVSVKTRIGFKTITTEEWIGHLLRQDLAALTIHGRTQKEMSAVPAHWDQIGLGVSLRDQIAPQTIVIGNGDVTSIEQGQELAKEHGVDGIMIGRGVFHNPWVFDASGEQRTPQAGLVALERHLDYYQYSWEGQKSYEPLKRFFKIYIQGYPGANDLRQRFMETHEYAQARALLTEVATTAKI
jgi:tRNA-dihydrouridine synthase